MRKMPRMIRFPNRLYNSKASRAVRGAYNTTIMPEIFRRVQLTLENTNARATCKATGGSHCVSVCVGL